MFSNTGALSFWLGIGFIFLAFIGVLTAYRLSRKEDIDAAKLDKLIDLGKWFIISVALVVGATIVSDGFKEREHDIQEIAVFEKYVSTITEAGGIEKRWLLADYFSMVAPAGELRNSWANYKLHITPELEEYKNGIKELNSLVNKGKKGDLTEAEATKAVELLAKTENFEQSLIPPTTTIAPKQVLVTNAKPSSDIKTTSVDSTTPEFLIVVGGDKKLDDAKFEMNKGKNAGFETELYKKDGMFRTVISGFSKQTDAYKKLPQAISIFKSGAYVVNAEKWCQNPQSNAEYINCK